MADLDAFDVIHPLQTEYLAQLYPLIRARRVMFNDRFELDHYMDGELNTNEADADGYHKQLTMSQYTNTDYLGIISYEPDEFSDAGILYFSIDSGTIHFNYKDSEGNVVEIT